MEGPEVDPLVSVLPIHLSNALSPNLHIYQYPLLTRPLQVPPSAAQSGKKIRARIKPKSSRVEVHVPIDLRPEVWNKERGEDLGRARIQDDQENGLDSKAAEAADPRLTEVRMRSEQIQHRGAYMLGIIRDGHLHLHPVQETHQLRPSLTYLDVFHRKARRRKAGDDSDSDSDDGPPPDPDDPTPAAVKKEPKASTSGEAKDIQVTIKKSDDKSGQSAIGLTAVRREMLLMMRNEEEEPWQDLNYYDGETEEAGHSFDSIFIEPESEPKLSCDSNLTTIIKSIPGL
ncbi:hypothetical protein SCHPADRAFT_918061 [Schizopora paradoxa]|uniref:DNA-directed RNA polymerase III subunit Rpc5 n=1 Tax=Schizopora paradoxa TaxID=27342 RepID=A0A0H2STX4_9AGAM|nr:hypothetical protein SCHPADRAFT_918061 [Schizopora paradoxa]